MTFQDNVVAVVLAGGEGKRLRPLSYYFQKCMIPIGSKQKPLLEYIIRFLRHHGITEVYLLISYKHEQIENYFGDGSRFGVNLIYEKDDPSMGGTGGALLNLYHKRLLGLQGSILIYYGDILSNLDLTEMLTQHQKRKAAATLALARGYQVPVGVAEVREDTVTGWIEKPNLDLCAGIGILAIDAKVIGEMLRLSEEKEEIDITGDLIQYLLQKGEHVHAYVTGSFWYDVGTTEKYEKLDNSTVEKHLSFLFS